MEFNELRSNGELVVNVIGRLDTNTAPEFEPSVEGFFKGGTETLIFDFSKLDYISSAGLRVILGASKMANAKGVNFKIRNVSPDVMEVFEITGFLDILNIE